MLLPISLFIIIFNDTSRSFFFRLKKHGIRSNHLNITFYYQTSHLILREMKSKNMYTVSSDTLAIISMNRTDISKFKRTNFLSSHDKIYIYRINCRPLMGVLMYSK